VSDFKPSAHAFYAQKVWRHTGLAVVGAFATGPDALRRSFAITTDLRLVPADRLKPDTASPFHGIELSGDLTLPMALVRAECDPKATRSCAHAYRITGSNPLKLEVHQLARTYPHRSVIALTGKRTDYIEGMRYYETKDGAWVRGVDIGVASAPTNWPETATIGQKWIEVSIRNQTLVLWEGQKPVFMTLVSTGQDGLGDPKTTKSTPLGFFRIQSKHVTATMDANEQSAEGKSAESQDKDVGEAKVSLNSDEDKGRGSAGRIARVARRDPKRAEEARGSRSAEEARGSRSAEESRQWGRPEGSFELRDVPYVEYFSSGYALHAAYWHDAFGRERSHGCINLSPIDAHRLFGWTEPRVPEGWHGAFSSKDARGTLLVVHE
jgi:lipoprotein-anchoring transpeptidase ErfK/SrfK